MGSQVILCMFDGEVIHSKICFMIKVSISSQTIRLSEYASEPFLQTSYEIGNLSKRQNRTTVIEIFFFPRTPKESSLEQKNQVQHSIQNSKYKHYLQLFLKKSFLLEKADMQPFVDFPLWVKKFHKTMILLHKWVLVASLPATLKKDLDLYSFLVSVYSATNLLLCLD